MMRWGRGEVRTNVPLFYWLWHAKKQVLPTLQTFIINPFISSHTYAYQHDSVSIYIYINGYPSHLSLSTHTHSTTLFSIVSPNEAKQPYLSSQFSHATVVGNWNVRNR